MKFKLLIFFILISIVFINYNLGCNKNKYTFENNIKPIIKKHCLSCHDNCKSSKSFYKLKRDFIDKNKIDLWNFCSSKVADFDVDEECKNFPKCGPPIEDYENFIKHVRSGKLMTILNDGFSDENDKIGSHYYFLGENITKIDENLIIFMNWINVWYPHIPLTEEEKQDIEAYKD